MAQRNSWDEVVGGMTMRFEGLEMAEAAGYNDNIGLDRLTQDSMIRARSMGARNKYTQNKEALGSRMLANGMENSGMMNKAEGMVTSELVGEMDAADLEARQRSDQVLAEEQNTWMSLMSNRSAQINAALQAEETRKAQESSWFDNVIGIASLAVPFIPGKV